VLAKQRRSERLREGLIVCDRGSPECRQVHADESAGASRGGDCLAACRTTRDIIEVQLDLDGYPVTVIDTAGIRDTDDPVGAGRRASGPGARGGSGPGVVAGRCDVRKNLDEGTARCGSCVTRSISTLSNPMREDGRVFDVAISASRGDGIAELISALVGFAQIILARGRAA